MIMREFKAVSIEGKIFLFPIPVVPERKYLISCSTVEEAEKIAKAVREGKLTHPDLISEDFTFLTYHSDKNTKIFILNPRKVLT